MIFGLSLNGFGFWFLSWMVFLMFLCWTIDDRYSVVDWLRTLDSPMVVDSASGIDLEWSSVSVFDSMELADLGVDWVRND